MLPTLDSDDVLLVNKFSRNFIKKLEVGKIYIFISPSDPERLICKRVTAKVTVTLNIVLNFKEYDIVKISKGESTKFIQVYIFLSCI